VNVFLGELLNDWFVMFVMFTQKHIHVHLYIIT